MQNEIDTARNVWKTALAELVEASQALALAQTADERRAANEQLLEAKEFEAAARQYFDALLEEDDDKSIGLRAVASAT